MANISRAHDCWTYVKPAQHNKDGRRAFLLRWNHFLGLNNIDNMASEAEAKLGSVSYSGERKKWTWEKYIHIYADQHAVLNGLTDYGYSGIDNGTKVHKLMAGIKIDALDTVNAAVMASTALRTNYTDFVTLYGDFIKQQKIESASMNVSDAHITRHHNDPASVAGSDYEASYDGVVEDRFYKHAEYRTLSPDQNKELWFERKHRGGDDNGRNKENDRRSNGKRVREDKRKKDKKTIKSLTRTIAALYFKTDDPESSSDEASDASDASEPPVKSNRTNSSLTRQKGSRKLNGADCVTSSMESLEICDITMHLGSLRQTGPACRSDIDSHANTIVVGMEVITFQDFERPVNVMSVDMTPEFLWLWL
jgi:hypothetical protein